MSKDLFREPNALEDILIKREKGPRRLWNTLPEDSVLRDKISGALWGRMIGCILGSPVELKSIEQMRHWSEKIGQAFPPVDYWVKVEEPETRNFYRAYRYEYEKENMKKVPVDDDIIYTQLALLILEAFGPEFTTADVGKAWLDYLPLACTAEEAALNNLKKGIAAEQAAEVDNPYQEWIGAAIRSDGFAYAAPGYPEKAAAMAYRDAFLSHRQNGIYGEMFLAAAQSAAFAVSDPMEAVRIGLTEIPQESALYEDITWALEMTSHVTNYSHARSLVDRRFEGMNPVHTNNNMCLVVFGLRLSGGDIVKGLSEIVAMGLDNDCTAASAGSILGALCGKSKIPPYLYERFNDTVDTYLNKTDSFKATDMTERFLKIAKGIYGSNKE